MWLFEVMELWVTLLYSFQTFYIIFKFLKKERKDFLLQKLSQSTVPQNLSEDTYYKLNGLRAFRFSQMYSSQWPFKNITTTFRTNIYTFAPHCILPCSYHREPNVYKSWVCHLFQIFWNKLLILLPLLLWSWAEYFTVLCVSVCLNMAGGWLYDL